VHSDDLQGVEAPLTTFGDGKGASGRPVILGEVLFDVFPDGARVLGGAPFNVAWHLQGFGLRPLLISRTGDDADGEAIIDAMISWGMDTTGVQRDMVAPTGQVCVKIAGDEPSFEILPDQAYDSLDRAAALAAVGRVETSLLYHGSLIARSATSRSTLSAIRNLDGLPAFVDVNLRAPWWSSSTMFSLLDGARWVKLNRNEIALLLEVAALGADIDICAAVRVLQQRHRLTQVIVTKGGEGASVRDGDVFTEVGPATPQEIVDTVGAGDAFSAVWIAGLISGWSTERTLARALDFAADVCTYQGAVTGDRSLYLRHLENWQET
jgi:fructokinase